LKTTNQLVVLSGILVILATATVAATFNVQTVEAKASQGDNFGQNAASPQAHDSQNDQTGGNGLDANSNSHLKNGQFGGLVSSIAKNP
jgi:hypothetical protein